MQERYAYNPYGVPAVLTSVFGSQRASSIAWDILYCGYRWDTGTGLFPVRNRVLNPVLGAWLQRDPIDILGGINLNEYCGGGPVSSTDQFGLTSQFWIGFVEGLLTSLILGLIIVSLAGMALALGAPAALITGILFLLGIAGGVSMLLTLYINDFSAHSVGYALGALLGGAIIGGATGRPLATVLSNKANAPAAGWAAWNPFDWGKYWHWHLKDFTSPKNFGNAVTNAMDSGPSCVSALGAVSACSAGTSCKLGNP